MNTTRYKTVKAWATGLLILMAVLYVVARSFEENHVVWPWVRAFAEAGMIGALADWFAVVALFKHPMGLPIPHTAIVKEQKDKIGAGLGRFVRNHFLTPEIIGEQVRKHEVVRKVLSWLAEEKNAQSMSGFIEKQLPYFINEQSFKRSVSRLSTVLCEKLAETPIERGAGKWMAASMHGEEFRGVVAPLFGKLGKGLAENKKWVEMEAGQRAPLTKSRILSRLTKGVTQAVSGHMVAQVSQTLSEASNDVQHPFYDKLEQSLKELGTELQSEEEHNEWARWRSKIFQSQGEQDTVEAFLLSAGHLAVQEKEELRDGVSRMLKNLAIKIEESPSDLKALEEEVVSYISKLSGHYGDAFEELIQSQFRAWDTDALSEKIEKSIGADLQFIRINGSLIGGLIGLSLHGIGLAIWG